LKQGKHKKNIELTFQKGKKKESLSLTTTGSGVCTSMNNNNASNDFCLVVPRGAAMALSINPGTTVSRTLNNNATPHNQSCQTQKG